MSKQAAPPPKMPLLMFSSFMIQEGDVWDAIWMPFRRGRSQHLEGSDGSRVIGTRRQGMTAGHMHTNLVRGGRAGLPKDWEFDVDRITLFADRASSPALDGLKFAFRYDLKTVARWNGLGEWVTQPEDGIRPIEMRENTPFWVEAVIPTVLAHEHPSAGHSEPPHAKMKAIFDRLEEQLGKLPRNVATELLKRDREHRGETLKEMLAWERRAGEVMVWVVLEGTGLRVVY